MAITTPTQLVDEFKKSGKFDRLRRELLSQFHRSDTTGSFTSRVEDIAQQRLLSDQKLQYMAPDAAHKELMKEMDRYPIVERAVEELQMLSDPSFAAEIRNSIQKILREDREKAAPPPNSTDNVNPASTVTSQHINGTIFRELPPPSVAEVVRSAIVQNSDPSSQPHGTKTEIPIPAIINGTIAAD